MKKNLLTTSLALSIGGLALSAHATDCVNGAEGSLDGGICSITASDIGDFITGMHGFSPVDYTISITENFQDADSTGSPLILLGPSSGYPDSSSPVTATDADGVILSTTNMNLSGNTNDKLLLDGTNLSKIEWNTNIDLAAGDDIVDIKEASVTVNSIINLGEGANTLTATNGSIFSASSQIIGGSGIDTLTFNTGAKADGTINTGDGADVLNFTDAFIGGNINGEAGDDQLTLSNTNISGSVNGGDGADSFNMTGGIIDGIVNGDAGDDVFDLKNITLNSQINSGTGNDTFTITDITSTIGSTVAATEGSIIETGEGDDTITVAGTSSLGTISMGTGSDALTLTGPNITLLNTLDGGDDTQDADGWIDTLTFDGWGAADWPTVGLTNWEYIVLKGSEFTATGNPTIDTGNLVVEGDGKLNIPDGAKLTGNLDNKGVVDVSNGTVGDAVLDIAGNYKGTGDVILDIDLGNEKADLLKVAGQVEDPINLGLNRVGNDHAGGGSAGILIVEAPNATASDIQYDGTVGGSAYVWDLEGRGGSFYLGYAETPTTPITPTDPITPSEPTDPIPPAKPSSLPNRPEFSAYGALPYIGRDISLSQLTTLHDRLGELRRLDDWVGTGPQNLRTNMGSQWGNIYDYIPHDKNIWAKAIIGGTAIESGDDNYGFEGQYGGMDLGIDYQYARDRHNVYYGGLFLGYRMGNFESDGSIGKFNGLATTDIDVDSYSIGGYATYFMNNKSFIDLVAKYTLFEGHMGYDQTAISESTTLAAYSSDVGGSAISVSGEFGHRVDLDDDFILEPQGQIVYNRMSWDDNNRTGLYQSSVGDSDFITARLGLRLEKTYELSKDKELKPWLRVNALQEFGSGGELTVKDDSGTYVVEGYELSTYGEFDLGVTYKAKDNIQLYGSANYRDDFSDYQSYEGAVGLRVSW